MPDEYLKIHEWLAVSIFIGVICAVALLTSMVQLTENTSAVIQKEEIEIVVKGAVANPGVYRFPSEMRLKDILGIAQLLPNADLRRYNLDSQVSRGRVINVPARTMISVHVEGAVKEKATLTIPKGTRLEELADIIAFADDADTQALHKKRRLKDQEVVKVPVRKH